ncbi:hypothetical protein M0R45_028393 [Rubus argutus]|uniref:Uncharacterized protein n=1 Tax=Rubus argutus TaxID=59490 RepID=A0AAW1W8Z9_RUBAR
MKRSFFDPEPEPRKKKSSKKVKKAEADPLKLKRHEDALVLLQNLQTLEDYEPFKSFEREMEQIQSKAKLVKGFTVGGDPTTLGELESNLYDTKSSIQRLVLNEIDNLPMDELRIDRAKKWKIEEIVKDFRVIVNEFMPSWKTARKSWKT